MKGGKIGVVRHRLILTMLGILVLPFTALAQDDLITAVKNNEVALVQELLRQDKNINSVAADGSTPLLWAAYNELPDMVSILLQAGADVSQANREGMVPIMLSVMNGDETISGMLLEAGANANQTLGNGESALMMAARTGDIPTLSLLLSHGADIDAIENQRGTTALMWAASYRRASAVKFLAEQGADISLQAAAIDAGRGSRDLAFSARGRVRSFYRRARQNALEESNREALDVMVELTAQQIEDASFEVSYAELKERLPKVLVDDFEREFIEEEAKGETQQAPKDQWGGLTALHFAVREGDLISIKYLIEAGADVNQLSEYGWSALLIATNNRYYQIGRYLIEQGAKPNLINGGGWSPLYLATDNRNIEGGDYPTRKPDMDHLDYIKLLLNAGAEVNTRMLSSTESRTVFTNQWLNEDGATPFLRAAQSSDLELMRLLLKHGADPLINTNEGITPLMVAAGIGWVEGITYEWSQEANRETIELLVELGIDANIQDQEHGRYALMGASYKGRNYAVQLLVDAGAKLDVRDYGSWDTINSLAGVTWQAIDYASGLVRVGVQSALEQPQTASLLRSMMLAQGLEVPEEGRTLDSICVVSICQ